jgi:hypothetical protein
MHRLDRFTTLHAPAHVGLVRDYDQEKFRCLKSRAALLNVVVEFEILDAGRRKWLTVADDGPLIPSRSEDGASHYFVLPICLCHFQAG